jgi:NADH-quinone oxidoreductase subunit J
MPLSETIVNLAFLLFAVTAVGGAIGVALSQNIVRSAFSLLMVLFSAAALYALMKVDFIFAVQILVYVGGILVLIIFAVMLTHKIVDVNVSNESTPTLWAAAATAALLAMLVGVALFTHEWRAAPPGTAKLPDNVPVTRILGEALMTTYLYPFEIISVLLLACLIGAAYLARKEVKD